MLWERYGAGDLSGSRGGDGIRGSGTVLSAASASWRPVWDDADKKGASGGMLLLKVTHGAGVVRTALCGHEGKKKTAGLGLPSWYQSSTGLTESAKGWGPEKSTSAGIWHTWLLRWLPSQWCSM